jgi:membrane protein DedA with SNARE-associated domain
VDSGQLPGIFGALEPILSNYGYLAVAGFLFLEDFGVPLPGETILIAGALYAGAGRLNVVLLALIAFLAAVAGDNVGFAIGRFGGRALVLRWGKYVLLTEERVAKAEKIFQRHGGWIVTIARFIEGLRQANGIVAGIAGMHWAKFLAFNALGAALWVGLWVTVGDLAGNRIDALYERFHHYEVYIGIAFAVLLAGFIAYKVYQRVRKKRGDSPRNEKKEQPESGG